LPDDVTKWKKDDFFRARKENNPKLIEAVRHLGKAYPGSRPSAEGLRELLKPLPPPPKPAEPSAVPPTAPGVPGTPPVPADPNLPPPGATVPPQGPGTPPPPPTTQVPPAPPPMHEMPMPGGTLPSSPGMNPAGSGPMNGLVEAIIMALADNGCDLARQTLEEVLSGQFATEDDKTAVEATLRAMVDHPCEQYDALLFRALTTPDALRPAERQGPWPAEELRTKTFELVKEKAAPSLRTKLAQALIERRIKLDPQDQMHAFLLADNQQNCEAQALFYEKGDVTDEVRGTLEKQLLNYCSLAWAKLLGITEQSSTATGGIGIGIGGGTATPPMPDQPKRPLGGLGGQAPPPAPPGPPGMAPPHAPPAPPGGTTSPSQSDKPTLPENTAGAAPDYRLAESLWTAAFLSAVEPRLSHVQSLEKNPQLVLLAGALPHDSTRAALYKLLKKRHGDGPQQLETAGLADRLLGDPALLLIIKTLPRRDATTTAAPGRPGAPTPPAGTGKRAEEVQKKQQLEQQWMDTSQKLLLAWCKRFSDAAEAKKKSAGVEGEAEVKLPPGFELNRQATIKSGFHFSWPDDLPPALAGLPIGQLEVYYVRAEESNKPRTSSAFYKRQTGSRNDEVHTKDKTIWLESMRSGSDKDHRRSLDVVLTLPPTYTPPAKAKDEDTVDMTVEVLCIEIKNPAKD